MLIQKLQQEHKRCYVRTLLLSCNVSYYKTVKFKPGKKVEETRKTYFKEGLSDTGHCILENWMAQA